MYNFRLVKIVLGESDEWFPCCINEHFCKSTLTGSRALLRSCSDTQVLCVGVCACQ
jgi:hypothetical protein